MTVRSDGPANACESDAHAFAMRVALFALLLFFLIWHGTALASAPPCGKPIGRGLVIVCYIPLTDITVGEPRRLLKRPRRRITTTKMRAAIRAFRAFGPAGGPTDARLRRAVAAIKKDSHA